MPFWVTWFLIGTFVTTGVAYSMQHASSVAALKTPPPLEQRADNNSEGN